MAPKYLREALDMHIKPVKSKNPVLKEKRNQKLPQFGTLNIAVANLVHLIVFLDVEEAKLLPYKSSYNFCDVPDYFE